jgi:hypothetical protein
MGRKLGFGSLFSNSFASLARVILHRLVGALALSVLLAPSVLAEKPRPPRAKNVEVTVMRGGSVQIPLRGFERSLNRLEYGVIARPRHGRLSDLTQYDGPDRQGPGQVTYTHANDDASTSDTFAFEVRSLLGNLRARGRVTIRILDAAPILQISPPVLDFGSFAIGDPPARGIVELGNVGGAVLQGQLEPPAPFLLGENGSFVLRRGESTRFPILFAPERPGPYLFCVQPVPGDPAILTLKGEALSPFSVEATDARFTLNRDGSRTAKAVVRNSSRQTQTINVVLPPESPVEPSAPFALAPDEEVEVVLRIPPEHKTAVRPFDVRFEGIGHAQVQQFETAAVPASLTVVAEPDFGEVRSGTAASADLVLRNEGGTSAQVKLLEHESINPANGATAVSIAAGEKVVVPLKLRLKREQALPVSIALSFQGQEVLVPIKASTFVAPSPTPSPEPSPAPPPERQWVLNEDIEYVSTPRGPALRWSERDGWAGFQVQHRPEGIGSWNNYAMPAPQPGLLERFRSLARKIESLLTTEIDRPDIDELGAGARRWQEVPIAEASAKNDIWRLTASRNGQPARSVTTPFRIAGDKLVSAEESPGPTPAPSSTPPVEEEPPAPDARKGQVVGPETKMASAGIKADRSSALLQVAFPAELGILNFRLEQGSMVAEIDPKTGIPGAPRFEVVRSPEVSVELLGLGESETAGEKFTICVARVSGLPAGTRTYWRVVPSGPEGELPPTTVILVDTQPLPPFPWNTALLVALLLLLCGVLYLRWRINRIPR